MTMTIFFSYVLPGRTEIFKFLLSRGAHADVEIAIESTPLTPLFFATLRGYASILEILLEQKADVIC
jgi:ankyrin repeat protein